MGKSLNTVEFFARYILMFREIILLQLDEFHVEP